MSLSQLKPLEYNRESSTALLIEFEGILISFSRFLASNSLSKREKIARLAADITSRLFLIFDPRLRYRAQRWLEIQGRPPGKIQVDRHREKYFVFSDDQTISRDLFLRGEFDFHKLKRAWKLIPRCRRDLALVDVGANLGTISIPAVGRGLFKKAVAIEASPEIAEVLRENVSLNGLQDVIHVVNSAVGPKDFQHVSFSVHRSNFGASRVVGSNSEEAFRVRSATLDTLLLDNSNIGLVFMDIEGFEGEALKGAEKLLAKSPPLALEFTPKVMTEFTTRSEFCALLSSYSCFYSLNDPCKKKYPISELARVWDGFLGEDGVGQTDLLFLKD